MAQSTRLYSAGKSGAVTPPGLVLANTAATNAASLPATQTIASSTAETVILDPALSATALILTIPPGGPCEQEEFDVVASGTLNLGTSSTVTIKLYVGTSTTPGSNTSIGSSGAVTAFSGKAGWKLRARLSYDTLSGKLQGTIQFVVNNNLVAEAAIPNVPTGISNTTFNGVINFVLSFTFGTGGTQVVVTHDFGVNH